MANKPEAAAAATSAPPAPVAPAASAPALGKALLPVVLVVVLAPAISWAVAQFVILPQFEQKLAQALATPPSAEAVEPHVAEASGKEEKGGHAGKKGEGGASNTYEFTNVVVNLSGTMGTRYLKATFMVTGKDNTVRSVFEANKPRLVDVTLNVLSSLSLADLEEVGAKNIIREKLVNSYNQVLGKPIAEQVYFSDFVVQ